VFAGGDVAFGPRNLIQAVANGKLAARSMHAYFTNHRARLETHLQVEAIPTATYRMAAGFEHFNREAPPTLDLGRRTGIAEVETGYGRDAAVEQAARCLVCHVQTIYDPDTCVLCNRCVDICPEYCLAFVPFSEVAMPDGERDAVAEQLGEHGLPLTALVKDDERCIRCGLCAIRCPTGAMTMERFSITEMWAEDV
jgi:ferredoxin